MHLHSFRGCQLPSHSFPSKLFPYMGLQTRSLLQPFGQARAGRKGVCSIELAVCHHHSHFWAQSVLGAQYLGIRKIFGLLLFTVTLEHPGCSCVTTANVIFPHKCAWTSAFIKTPKQSSLGVKNWGVKNWRMRSRGHFFKVLKFRSQGRVKHLCGINPILTVLTGFNFRVELSYSFVHLCLSGLSFLWFPSGFQEENPNGSYF